MKVTFLGGPKHGAHEDIENPPERIEVADSEGRRFMYEKAFESYMGVGDHKSVAYYRQYALVGSSIHDRLELARAAGKPPLLP